MVTSFLIISVLLWLILVVSVLHLPRLLQRVVVWTPAWLQAAVIHFGYGGWIGGVTGHVVSGFLAVSWFFTVRYWLQPRLASPRPVDGDLALNYRFRRSR